jgi:hypothetical protein
MIALTLVPADDDNNESITYRRSDEDDHAVLGLAA